MKFYLYLLPAAGVLFLTGCSTYTEQTNAMTQSARAGNVQLAAQQSLELAKKNATSRDAIIFEVEAGTAQRALGLAKLPMPPPPAPPAGTAPAMGSGNAAQPPVPSPAPVSPSDGAYEKSLHIFASADDSVNDYEEKAKHSVSAGITSAVVNPATTPYRGEAYDKVMISTYQAINYLQLGYPEKARASLNKAYKRQADAVAENSKRIEIEKDKLEAAKSGKIADDKGKTATGFDTDKAQSDPKVTAAMVELNSSLDSRMKAYADYVNPFAVFMDGLFMMTNAADAQEQERAAKEFQRVASMDGDNTFLMEDAMLAEDLAKGNALPRTTYVIFESGEAPHKEEVLIPVPLFLLTQGKAIVYTQVPISKLVFNDQANRSLTVDAGNGSIKQTLEICNMDSVIARDFKNRLPSMWVDALVCAATKAIIIYEADKEIDKNSTNPLASLLMKSALAISNAATTRADTRSWRSLPKTFSYARFATPDSGSVTVSTPDGRSKLVTLPANAKVSVVYVKQTQLGTDLWADAFVLR